MVSKLTTPTIPHLSVRKRHLLTLMQYHDSLLKVKIMSLVAKSQTEQHLKMQSPKGLAHNNFKY